MATTTDLLARFETAQETIGILIAGLAHQIGCERSKSEPCPILLKQWEAEQARLADEEDRLRLHDEAEVARVLEFYGPAARELMAGSRSTRPYPQEIELPKAD